MQIAESNSPAAENVARIIKNKGLKQVYVAEKAGYAPQELNNMLNGRRLIKSCDILRLATTLEVTANDIYAVGKEEE